MNNGARTKEQKIKALRGLAQDEIPSDDGDPSLGEDSKAESESEPEPKRYSVSIFPGEGKRLPIQATPFVDAVHKLEEMLEMPAWLLVQHGGSMIEPDLIEAFFEEKDEMPEDGPIALVIDSPGGIAKSAFQLANLLRRHCGGFVAVVPRSAKSAATLLALGASHIVLGKYAELGPLDVQLFDANYEGMRSGLDEVQSVERLFAAALQAVNDSMFFWAKQSGKKLDTLMPIVSHFVAEMMQPMFDKIDTVSFTQKSRIVKEAEEYAIRLLKGQHGLRKASSIARALVENYPVHDFDICGSELRELGRDSRGTMFGLDVIEAPAEMDQLFDTMRPFIRRMTVVGRIVEVDGDDGD